jgi:hypothetical protein
MLWFDTNVSEHRAASILKNLKIEAARSTETFVSDHHATRLNNPENYEM